MSSDEQRIRRFQRRYFASESGMPEYGSPSSSVSSLSSTADVVFSAPALAATRENDVVDLEEDGSVFNWPAVESPAAHAPIQPTRRARQPSSTLVIPSQAALSISERWRHALANRDADQANDPSTSLARRIAARDALRQSQSQSPSSTSEPTYPTARLLSRTTIPVSEPEPPADLRRLATTREAERQLHYRDWHRLGLLDPPSSSVAGVDSAGVTPGRLIPTSSYARRRARLPSLLDPNGDEDDEISELSHRLHRRMSPSTLTDAMLEQHALGTRWLEYERRLIRSRIWISGPSAFSYCPSIVFISDITELTNSDSPGHDINGDDDDTPAARSRYWNARTSSATDDLLSLATEILALLTRLQSSAAAERHAQRSPTPATPPGLGIFDSENNQTARPEPRTVPTKPDPLPTPLESMILPTPRQRYMAALKAPNS
ncbi:unnamed protein product [Rhizoctonia solani]|uniref:Uncharacterized protein n=1 Tax=Rhizoctonia solani TaxID=456999 RepID=A0A8H3D865_9AGAM|nr:unnamed protein product [Rhizoctonia solani]